MIGYSNISYVMLIRKMKIYSGAKRNQNIFVNRIIHVPILGHVALNFQNLCKSFKIYLKNVIICLIQCWEYNILYTERKNRGKLNIYS